MYAYRKCMPRSNKILEDKWVKHCQHLHRRKLKEMKSYVDTAAPTTTRLVHLTQNLKRQQLDEERYSQIERENYLLLDKMSYIMTHPQLLDEKYMGAPVSYGKSLNREFRKRELMRITEENQQILRRIQRKEPHYSHLEWEEKAKRDDEYLRNCAEYPIILTGRDNLTPRHTGRTPRLAPLGSRQSARGDSSSIQPQESRFEEIQDAQTQAVVGSRGSSRQSAQQENFFPSTALTYDTLDAGPNTAIPPPAAADRSMLQSRGSSREQRMQQPAMPKVEEEQGQEDEGRRAQVDEPAAPSARDDGVPRAASAAKSLAPTGESITGRNSADPEPPSEEAVGKEGGDGNYEDEGFDEAGDVGEAEGKEDAE